MRLQESIKRRLVYEHAVEYEGGGRDANVAVSALKNCSETSLLKIRNGVEGLSW